MAFDFHRVNSPSLPWRFSTRTDVWYASCPQTSSGALMSAALTRDSQRRFAAVAAGMERPRERHARGDRFAAALATSSRQDTPMKRAAPKMAPFLFDLERGEIWLFRSTDELLAFFRQSDAVGPSRTAARATAALTRARLG